MVATESIHPKLEAVNPKPQPPETLDAGRGELLIAVSSRTLYCFASALFWLYSCSCLGSWDVKGDLQ